MQYKCSQCCNCCLLDLSLSLWPSVPHSWGPSEGKEHCKVARVQLIYGLPLGKGLCSLMEVKGCLAPQLPIFHDACRSWAPQRGWGHPCALPVHLHCISVPPSFLWFLITSLLPALPLESQRSGAGVGSHRGMGGG